MERSVNLPQKQKCPRVVITRRASLVILIPSYVLKKMLVELLGFGFQFKNKISHLLVNTLFD